MKRTLLFLAFVVAIALCFEACKKENEKDEHQIYSERYFDVPNASFVSKDFPAPSSGSNAPDISRLYGNHSVLAGGSNLITIESLTNISYVLVGVEGMTGYYKIPESALDEVADNTYLFYLAISQELELQNMDIVIAIVDSDDLISDYSIISVSQIEAGTGLLQISCTWDKLNDVDLHLIEPSQEEIYWENSFSANGGDLDVDSNAACDIDGVNNENITYSDDAIIENGTYTVNVDLFSNCNVAGSTNYIVTAYYDGKLINPSFGSNPYIGTFNSYDEDHGREGDGKTVLRFNIDSSLKAASMDKSKKLIRFKYATDMQVKAKDLSPQKANLKN